MRPMLKLIAPLFLGGIALLVAGAVAAQSYPNKTIRIVTSEAGGGNDLAARLIGQAISGPLGQQVIVDNRAGGIIPGDVVSKAPPDGYTILWITNSLWITPLLQDNVPYDPLRDFSPIAVTHSLPNVLVVHPSLPVKSVADLITLAKARPGALNYSTAPKGSTQHLTGELFKSMAGLDIAAVPYKGAGPAITALIGGEVQLMFPSTGSVAQHIKSGRLRAVAVTSAQPLDSLPGVPAIAATVPGYEAVFVNAVFAPANTAAPVINRLNQAIVQVLRGAELKKRFVDDGAEIVAGSPEQLSAFMKSDVAKWGKVIKEAGIRVD